MALWTFAVTASLQHTSNNPIGLTNPNTGVSFVTFGYTV